MDRLCAEGYAVSLDQLGRVPGREREQALPPGFEPIVQAVFAIIGEHYGLAAPRQSSQGHRVEAWMVKADRGGQPARQKSQMLRRLILEAHLN